MPFNLHGFSLISLVELSQKEILYLIDLARDLKKAKYTGNEIQHLKGKSIALIFEKNSTRTRCAFEVAAYDQGAHVTFLGPSSSHIGEKETMKDTARVLGRMYNAIEYRGFKQETLLDLVKYAGVPVFNGLTDDYHPTQMFADILTMVEHSNKPIRDISFTYLGDARSNMGNSILLLGAKLGLDTRIAAPKSLWPNEKHLHLCKEFARESGAKITMTENVDEAVKNVDYIYTDVWVSMGESADTWDQRIKHLMPFQVNDALIKKTGNDHVKFLHCLPAFHNTQTKVGYDVSLKYPQLKNGIEVTESVFESKHSIVFDQAENRMHSIKAILVASLGNI